MVLSFSVRCAGVCLKIKSAQPRSLSKQVEMFESLIGCGALRERKKLALVNVP
ncbi:hypothetical protein [Methylocystis sp.]|uniref:hypothetical protein n=1 Tax=Methylocystis sp. TaxID=1911079 RepID=UPI003DA53F83